MAFVTFAPKDPQGGLLDECRVSILSQDCTQILHANLLFGPATLDGVIRVVELAAGTYSLWVRAFGYRFAFPLEVEVLDDDSTEGDPQIHDLPALSSSTPPPQLAVGLCRVWGHCPAGDPWATASRSAKGYGVVERRGILEQQSYRGVRFYRIEGSLGGEAMALSAVECVDVGVDENGYFETTLLAEHLYRIHIPGVRGLRFLTTPAAGQDADVETLIDADISSAPYALIQGGL